MKKETTYKIAFYCFVAAVLLILFTAITSCSQRVIVMPSAPVHPIYNPPIVNQFRDSTLQQHENKTQILDFTTNHKQVKKIQICKTVVFQRL